MSYPGDYEDEDETGTGYGTVGISGANPLAVKQISDDYALGVKDRNARRSLEIFAPQQALFDKYAEDLKARRAGPDFSQRMYELSAALMKPTAYKGFGATLGNVLPVLAQQRAAMQDAESAKQDLLMKYKLQAQEALGQQLESGFKAEDALAKADYAARLAVLKGAPKEQPLPSIVYTARLLYPDDKTKQNEYILRNSPANIKATSSAPKQPAPTNLTPPWEH